MIIGIRSTARHIGTIVAVWINNGPQWPKHFQQSARIGSLGREGPDTERHVCVLAQEILDFINQKLHSTVGPGDLSESITTVGLGDLSDVPPGARIKVYGIELFEVIGHREIPKLMRAYSLNLYQKCGLICRITGDPKTVIRPGDVMEILW